MGGFSENECEACERCGAFIPTTLAKFHRCPGSDTSKRPVNIPLATWLQLQERAVSANLEQLDVLISRLDNIHVRTRVSSKPPPPKTPPEPRHNEPEFTWAFKMLVLGLALFLAIVVPALFFILE